MAALTFLQLNVHIIVHAPSDTKQPLPLSAFPLSVDPFGAVLVLLVYFPTGSSDKLPRARNIFSGSLSLSHIFLAISFGLSLPLLVGFINCLRQSCKLALACLRSARWVQSIPRTYLSRCGFAPISPRGHNCTSLCIV